MATAPNDILIQSRLIELEWLCDASWQAFERGEPWLMPGNSNGPALLSLSEALALLRYSPPRSPLVDYIRGIRTSKDKQR